MLQSSLAVFERSGYVFPQLRPVLLDRRNIVRALLDCLARCILPVAHAVYGYDAALDFKGLAGFLDGCYLIGTVVGLDLSERDAVRGRPRARHVDGGFAVRPVRQAPDDFAVYRLDLRSGRATFIPARDEAFHIVLRRL